MFRVIACLAILLSMASPITASAKTTGADGTSYASHADVRDMKKAFAQMRSDIDEMGERQLELISSLDAVAVTEDRTGQLQLGLIGLGIGLTVALFRIRSLGLELAALKDK